MASTCSMVAACSGWRRAANRKSERIAASLALRVVTLLARSCCRWSRKTAISCASRSAMSRVVQSRPTRRCARVEPGLGHDLVERLAYVAVDQSGPGGGDEHRRDRGLWPVGLGEVVT